jgi:hypothetical protein
MAPLQVAGGMIVIGSVLPGRRKPGRVGRESELVESGEAAPVEI